MEWSRLQSEFYDKNAALYDEQRRGSERAYDRKARHLVDGLPAAGDGLDVLEVGSGSGLVTLRALSRTKARSWMGVELSPSMIERARGRCGHDARATFVQGNAAELPTPDRSIDAVVCVDLLHHLDDPTRALREWRRAARPRGLLAALETNAFNPLTLQFLGVPHEKRVFLNTPWNLARWARDAGWRDVRVRAAAAFTPSGPAALAAPLDAVDAALARVPALRWITALWLVTGAR